MPSNPSAPDAASSSRGATCRTATPPTPAPRPSSKPASPINPSLQSATKHPHSKSSTRHAHRRVGSCWPSREATHGHEGGRGSGAGWATSACLAGGAGQAQGSEDRAARDRRVEFHAVVVGIDDAGSTAGRSGEVQDDRPPAGSALGAEHEQAVQPRSSTIPS